MRKEILFLVIVLGVFLVGCTQSSPDYSAYAQGGAAQGGQQQQYVGGGCGVAQQADYAQTPVGAFDSSNHI